MPMYKVSGKVAYNVSVHMWAKNPADARVGLMVLGQRMAHKRLGDDTEVADFTWTDVTTEVVED